MELMSKDMSSLIDLANTNLKSAMQVFNVQGYGAKADGVANDAPAIQAAIDAATAAGGGIVYLPPGTYLCNQTLLLDRSTNASRVSLVGSGSGSATLKYSGSGTLLNVIGSNSTVNDDYLSYQIISGLKLVTTSIVQGIAVSLYKLALIRLVDLWITGFDTGLYMNGVEHSKFEALSFRWNNKGIYATSTDFVALTCPNNLTFYSCHIGSNAVYGALFEFSTTVNFVGGSIENNGTNAGITGAAVNWGIKFRNAGYQGGVACNLLGVYLESNAGTADLWVENTAWEVTVDNAAIYTVVGCTFNRGTSDHYPTNNIRCTFAIVAQAELQKLSVVNSSFKAFNTYVPSSSRKTILYDGVPQNADNFETVGSIFEVAVEAPSFHRIQRQHISVAKNAVQSLSSAAWTKWAINAELNNFDMTGALDTTNNQVTIPMNGVYSISVHVVFAFNTTGNRGIRIKNGTSIIGCSVESAQEQEHTIHVVYCGNTNDLITVELFQSSGGSLNVLGSDTVVSSVVITKIADMA